MLWFLPEPAEHAPTLCCQTAESSERLAVFDAKETDKPELVEATFWIAFETVEHMFEIPHKAKMNGSGLKKIKKKKKIIIMNRLRMGKKKKKKKKIHSMKINFQ